MSDKIILYHGSFCIVQNPDLSRCVAGKDFGQGFYLTTSKIQTQKFVATSVKKALTQKVLTTQPSKGYVNAFEFTPSENLSLYELRMRIFPGFVVLSPIESKAAFLANLKNGQATT